MYHVEMINIKKSHPLFDYCSDITNKAKNMYNVANFYIRNTMTALSKQSEPLTVNEKGVLSVVQTGVALVNKRGNKQFSVPTADHWFLNYGMLDGVFKAINNVDYRSHHVHVMQNAIRDCAEAWKSYFELQKLYNRSPAQFTGKPKLPHYVKANHRTAVVSNAGCRIVRGMLAFPRTKLRLDVSALPHSCDKLIEVRISPYFDLYRVQIVTDDGTAEIVSTEPDSIPSGAGVMMLDPGLENFATLTDNKGFTPIVIKGGVLKAANQWFNKQCAKLRSIRMLGHDPKVFHPSTTKQIDAICRKRDAFLRDTFYKTAHYICRLMTERDLRYLLFGKNVGWKQGVHLGHKTNQEFVQIPFASFLSVLKTVARKYDITVITQEESYTSKASFLDNDEIPDYEPKAETKYSFSGKRVKRGLYKTKDGFVINADVNGAANIGRKYDPAIFEAITDFSYLTKTVKSVRIGCLPA